MTKRHSKAEARALGLKHFFGNVCAKHPELAGERYVSRGNCAECCRVRARKANKTPEQIATKNAKQRERNVTPEGRARKRIANMTPGQIERVNAKQRIANMTPEQIERKRASKANMTPEQIERQRERNATPERRAKRLDNIRRWQYNITSEQFDVVLAAQGNRCGICRSDAHGGKSWHVDHDHTTKQVRGILCHGCNVSLGAMRDIPETLERGASYLRESASFPQGRFAKILEIFAP